MNIMEPKAAGVKTKHGDLVVDVGQIMRNLNGVEQEDGKKSILQKLLEPKDVDDSEKDMKKAQRIAKKIARGEPVTPQEKQFLRQVDPKLAQMAELARKEGERIKHALQQASSKEEQQSIVQQAYQQVTEVSKENPQFGELLGEALKAAIQEAKEEPKAMGKPEAGMETEEGRPYSLDGHQDIKKEAVNQEIDRQEEILEQFYPEEWASMLDCKG